MLDLIPLNLGSLEFGIFQISQIFQVLHLHPAPSSCALEGANLAGGGGIEPIFHSAA